MKISEQRVTEWWALLNASIVPEELTGFLNASDHEQMRTAFDLLNELVEPPLGEGEAWQAYLDGRLTK